MRALKARLGYLNIKLKTFKKLANSNVRQRRVFEQALDVINIKQHQIQRNFRSKGARSCCVSRLDSASDSED